VYHAREPIGAEVDAAGYDAQAIGNREFHYLFGCVQARARRMNHPLVCANLVDVRNRPLPFVPQLEFERADGERRWNVVVFGLLVPQYPAGSPWERVFGWRFLDPFAVADAVARRVPEGTVLIALSHLGLRADRDLAARVPRLDLILGGHSHDTLPVPEFVGDVPIVHAGPYGEFVSRTTLEATPGERPAIAQFALLPLRAAAAAGAGRA
jgi:2',3'-cyclic-nucleotide 2'-phosphodiesterase (5'-nucleotidase family)